MRPARDVAATWVRGTVLHRYEIFATRRFEDDLDTALSWRLREVGRSSSQELYSTYLSKLDTLETFPLLGGRVEGSEYRCTAMGVTCGLSVDEAARVVTLMRLFHMSADWRARLLR